MHLQYLIISNYDIHIPQFGETLFRTVGSAGTGAYITSLACFSGKQEQIMRTYALITRIFVARFSCKTGSTCIYLYSKNAFPTAQVEPHEPVGEQKAPFRRRSKG
jgi:hypothetical protein